MLRRDGGTKSHDCNFPSESQTQEEEEDEDEPIGLVSETARQGTTRPTWNAALNSGATTLIAPNLLCTC